MLSIFKNISTSITRKLKLIFSQPKLALTYILYNIGYFFGLPIPSSQYGEDSILAYLIQSKEGFYVDIGSNDPCFGNNTYIFHNKGWKGITIEPNKEIYKKIKKYRPTAINLNVAVGKGGSLVYHEIDTNGLSTCNKEIVENYIRLGHRVTNSYSVHVRKLESIFDEYVNGKHIDILSIDVEGMEMEVLESNNWNKYKPSYIILETVVYEGKDSIGIKNDAQYTTYLKQYGYTIIADTYINTIYCQTSNTNHSRKQ